MINFLSLPSNNRREKKQLEREENLNQNMSLHSPLIVEETKHDKKEEERRELVEEVKKQLWLSGPLISVALLNFSINLISVMFVGHLGELSLSGASMATSFAAISGFTLLVSSSILPIKLVMFIIIVITKFL